MIPAIPVVRVETLSRFGVFVRDVDRHDLTGDAYEHACEAVLEAQHLVGGDAYVKDGDSHLVDFFEGDHALGVIVAKLIAFGYEVRVVAVVEDDEEPEGDLSST